MTPDLFGEIDPPHRLLMGPGPVNAHPRVLRAMSADLLGQFDPEMTGYMEQVMALYRPIFGTGNRWTFLIDGTARAGIEAALVSLLAPGDTLLVIDFGRFGLLLREIGERIGARIEMLSAPWGETVPIDRIAAAIERVGPEVVACVHGDTSTTMAQPLDGLGALCRAAGAYSYVDATATIGGMAIRADEWGIDVVTGGLQKCLGGPSGSAPITISDRAAEYILSRRHVEKGLARADLASGPGTRIGSNYFDLAMVMDYWSDKRLNHHTEATSMLYGARECARVMLGEGLEQRYRPPRRSRPCDERGPARAWACTIYGDDTHRMTNVTGVFIPDGIDNDRVRAAGCATISKSRLVPPSVRSQARIWRIGAMGYNAMKHKVLITLGALEAVPDARGLPPAARRGGWRGAGGMGRMRRPHRLWPDPARPTLARWCAHVAVQFVVNYEEGAENSVLNGDAEARHSCRKWSAPSSHPARAMAMESLYEYGSRAGFWRLHRLFTERGLPVTIFGVAATRWR
jgi:(S)-ureidoglycine-glyoxylate aminotransferase